jgi:hypothetical protein
MIVIHAAQAAAKARLKVFDAFRLRGATAPERARPLSELGISPDDSVLSALLGSGVIRGIDHRGRPAVIGHEDTRIEKYYLDEGAYISERDRSKGLSKGARAVVLVLGIVLALLVIPLLFLRIQRG